MNLRYLIPLLKNEWKRGFLGFSISLIYVWLVCQGMKAEVMFSLSSMPSFMFLPVFWGTFGLSFPEGFQRARQSAAGGSPSDSLEFFFSRAIPRSSLFYAKTSLYLAIIAFPLMTIWLYSNTRPMIKVELPYATAEVREQTKDFFLTQFEGAYLEVDPHDKKGDKVWVVLPHGQVACATFGFFLATTTMLLFQCCAFVFFGRPGIGRPIVFALFFVAVMGVAFFWPATRPSLYEVGVAWAGQRPLLMFGALFILLLASQRFCCHRFTQTEITA